MPMKPGKDEDQSKFMARCVPDMMGQNGGTKRPNEQAVAACLSIWRDAKGGKKPSKAITSEQVGLVIKRWREKFKSDPSYAWIARANDAPEPEDDESKQDFIDRCTDELTAGDDGMDDDEAENACEAQWEDFAEQSGAAAINIRDGAHGTAVVHKQHDSSGDGMEFVLSDATPDRFGDIVVPAGWDITNFVRNPVALFNHNPDFVIGRWRNITVANEALRGHLVMAPKGSSPRIDEIRSLIDAGILRAVSVGFKPIERKPREEGGEKKGFFYVRSELVETSLVAIPANPNALAVAKGLHISPETKSMVFAEHGKQNTKKAVPDPARGASRTRASVGEHAKHQRSGQRGGSPMLLGKRVEEAERFVVQLQDELTAHLESVDDQNVDDASMTVTEELTQKIAGAERHRDSLKAAETRLAKASERAGGGGNGGGDGGGNGGGGLPIVRTSGSGLMRPFGVPAKKMNSIDYLIRQGVIQFFAHKHHKPVDDVRSSIYGEDEATRAYLDYAVKAASSPAMTAVTGWAAELVQQVYADFMALLVPSSVMPKLAGMGLALTFGRAGRVIIPTRNLTPSLAGSFVGEGQAIPVRQGGFGSQTLTPKKLAVITTWTREMDEHSIPAIEGLLREAVQQDTSIALDTVLLDANPATAIRPAGLRNGVAGLTPTAGGGFNALVGDIKQMTGALLTATAGHVRAGVFLMNPQQVLSISLIQPPAAATGLFPFAQEVAAGRLRSFTLIESGNVPLGTVLALDAADFVSVGSDAPRFEVSDQATLHLEDTSPSDITGGTPSPATPVKSMFQTDSMALRLIWPTNWTLRRPGMVSWVTGVTW